MRHQNIVLAGILIGACACGAPADTASSEDAVHNGGKEVWITAQATHFVKVLHPKTGTLEQIALPSGAQPHMVDLSPSGNFAYASNMGNGTMTVIRTSDRSIVTTLSFGATASTHQTKVSPDGGTLLVHQIQQKILYRLAADEANETWTITGQLALGALPAPICSVYTADGSRVYLSLAPPGGVVEVDVASMTIVNSFAVGSVQCGLTMDVDRSTVYVTDNAGGGRVWTIDVATGSLSNLNAPFSVTDLHGSALSKDESKVYVTGRQNDEFETLNLATNTVTSLSLDLTPGFPDAPEQIVVSGSKAWLVLGNGGKLVKIKDGVIKKTWDIAPPAFGSGFLGRSLHGIAIKRPDGTIINIGDTFAGEDED